jgi:ankyrin repeat protein
MRGEMDPFMVVAANDIDAVVTMLNNGVKADHTRWSGFSLLHRAAQEGNTDVCEVLIDRGADVNVRSSRGWYTPLHCALANGYVETAEFLLSRGAKPWIVSKYKEDPFDYGAKHGYKELCTDLRNKMMKMEMVQSLKRADKLMKRDLENSRKFDRPTST